MSKADKKHKEKIIQDKTFGLKNKNKSKVVQNYCKGVAQTVKNHGKSAAQLESEAFEIRKQKKKEEEQAALLNALYNQVGKVRKNAQEEEQEDPKNIVCPYFKQGLCQKGKKCIYSHDLTLDRTQQIDLYVDQRTQIIMNEIGGKQLNLISEEQLNNIIQKKQKEFNIKTKSQIVCKYFLEAVEKGKYGWNWNCVNGDKCQYKHCLPPGYRLKKDSVKVVQQQTVDIEAKIDEERNKLLNQNISSPLVTLQVFMKWKAQKQQKKLIEAEKKKKEQQKKKGSKNMRTGKQLFTYDPTIFVDDQEAADNYEERQQIQEDQQQYLQKRQPIRGSDDEQIIQQKGQNQQQYQKNQMEKNEEETKNNDS